ncbi:hypothetical protein [Staphylococcus aureus]|uniref:hypothetical protein n=1 Tax=Staphylococcus aureus TaxID=1280 RepID=UPI003F69C367
MRCTFRHAESRHQATVRIQASPDESPCKPICASFRTGGSFALPTLMGWGCIPDDHELMAGMVGLQTAHRYGNATLLASDMVFGIGNRFANRHTGSVEKYTEGRKIVHIDIEPTQIGRVLCPDLGIVSDAKAALTLLVEVAQEMQKAGRLPCRKEWVADCQQRKRTLLRKTHFDNVPVCVVRGDDDGQVHLRHAGRYRQRCGFEAGQVDMTDGVGVECQHCLE